MLYLFFKEGYVKTVVRPPIKGEWGDRFPWAFVI